MSQNQKLTTGNISGHLIRLAAPLIISNILQQFYHTIDTWMIGRYAGASDFAAIGVAGSVMNLFIFAVSGSCTGIAVLFARFYGAEDMETFRCEHFTGLLWGLISTVILSLAGILCLPFILRLVQTPTALMPSIRTYLTIILLALPATFLYNFYGSLLRSVGQAAISLYALTAAAAANIFLDYLFLAHFRFGIAGAAWATAISQLASALICILWLFRHMPSLLFRRRHCQPNRRLLAETAHYGFITGLHQSGLYIGKLLVQGAVNYSGTDMICAYTASGRIEGFANSFGDSGAAATSIMTAQNLGADKKKRVQKTFWCSLLLLFLFGIVSSLLMFVTAPSAVSFMLGTDCGPAYEQALAYIRTVSIFYVFCFTGNTFAGYFDGCGRVTIPFIGAISHIMLRAVLSWLLIDRLQLNAVAIATGTGWILVNLFWGVIGWRLHRKSLTPQSRH